MSSKSKSKTNKKKSKSSNVISESKSKSTKKNLKSNTSEQESSNVNSKSISKSNIKKGKKKKKSSSISEIKEEDDDGNDEESEEGDEEEEEEELDVEDDNYKEEKAKLMPKRKVSTEKVNGKVKQRLMGNEQKLKIAIRGRDPLKGKDTIKDFSKSDIDNMYFIIENFQSYGDDLDSNEVDLLDKVLYSNKNLEKYYLFANEYNFDPGEMISSFTDKLLEKIQINFSKHN